MRTEQQPLGDGQDHIGSAARQARRALQGPSRAQAAGRAIRAGNAIKAGAKTGKTVAKITAGSAAGGPVGAALAAAWSMRHTLFRILVCAGLFVLLVAVMVTSLPEILWENMKDAYDPDRDASAIEASYIDLFSVVEAALQKGHEAALGEVEQIMENGNYDSALSSAHLVDCSQKNQNEDVCYILAAYSVVAQKGECTKENLVYRLQDAAQLYPVTYEEQTDEESNRTYIVCTVHPLDRTVIDQTLRFDPNAPYVAGEMSCGEMAEFFTEVMRGLFSLE